MFSRVKLVVFALGVLGLAGALTVAALVAPEREISAARTYVPAGPATVVARVPQRGGSPVTDVEAIRARAQQAADARDWSTAGRELDALVARRPDDARAHLARAAAATNRADYAAARASCAAVARVAPALVAATCVAPLDGLAHPAEAAAALAAVLAATGTADPGLGAWAEATLGALALQVDDAPAAAAHLSRALALDPTDDAVRAALADVELAAGDLAALATVLAGPEAAPALLLRRALAAKRAGAADAEALASRVREGNLTARDEARFALAIDGDAARAVKLAAAAWRAEPTLASARVLAEAASEARDAAAAAPVRAWRAANHVVDAPLDRALGAVP